MAYLEELLSEFIKGAKIRCKGWDDGAYLLFDTKEEIIIDQEGRVCEFIPSDIVYGEWEFYKEPELDWEYIIKNKCLCWFWDIVEEAKIVGILCKINDDGEHKFVRNFEDAKIAYIHCRPVHRDEVTFYEDKTDE